MATLGYRDSGSVVLSKAEALRQAHEKEGERSRLMTWSKRKSPPRRKKDEREEREKEEAAEFEMKLENIVQKRPDKRLKWLQKGMILVGRKTIKANAFFELIMAHSSGRRSHWAVRQGGLKTVVFAKTPSAACGSVLGASRKSCGIEVEAATQVN
ncbi:Hypothetical protein (Fragment) [Durusdinium trenchii]|uniref:Uncharacterized protein n=1 Tax=Durusdinium trenchii TaxID=1381693 RepID=A0ABP0RG25_9DINO